MKTSNTMNLTVSQQSALEGYGPYNQGIQTSMHGATNMACNEGMAGGIPAIPNNEVATGEGDKLQQQSPTLNHQQMQPPSYKIATNEITAANLPYPILPQNLPSRHGPF